MKLVKTIFAKVVALVLAVLFFVTTPTLSFADVASSPKIAFASKKTTTITSGAKGSDYTTSSLLAQKLDSIFSGHVSIYSDAKCTKVVVASLGSSVMKNHSVYGDKYYYRIGQKGQSTQGSSCWAYGVGVYFTLFSELVGSGKPGKNSESITGIKDKKITYDNFVKYGVRNEPGALIRVGNHSVILLKYNSTTLTVLDANSDGRGLTAIREIPFNGLTGSMADKIVYVIQPKEEYYNSFYRVILESSNYQDDVNDASVLKGTVLNEKKEAVNLIVRLTDAKSNIVQEKTVKVSAQCCLNLSSIMSTSKGRYEKPNGICFTNLQKGTKYTIWIGYSISNEEYCLGAATITKY